MGGQHRCGGTFREIIPAPAPPPSYLPDAGAWQYLDIPSILVWQLHFPQAMSSHVPNAACLTLKIDGVPEINAFNPSWKNNQTLERNESQVSPHPTTVTLSYDGLDPLFATADGHAVTAFTDFVLTES